MPDANISREYLCTINIIMPIRGVGISGMWCQPDYGMCTWCETVCTLRVRAAQTLLYILCACSFGEDARYPLELPRLSIQPVPQSGEQHIHNAVLPDKGTGMSIRLGNKELPPTWGYGRPIPNAIIPCICLAVLSAIYFLYQSVRICSRNKSQGRHSITQRPHSHP